MARRNRDEQTNDPGADGVATPDENAALEGSVDDAPETTRDDLHDLGVPMLQGDPREPVGPEDALGVGEKRGDYRDRIVGQPHTAVALEGGGEPVYRNAKTGDPAEAGDDDAVIVDYKPTSTVVPQRPRADEIGNSDPLLKGGVTTDPTAQAAALGVDTAAVAAPSVAEAR